MKPARFAYHAPTSLEEAADLLAELGDAAKVLAGGQSLVPMMAFRLAIADDLVDIGAISELRGVQRLDGDLVIGAGTRHAAIGRDPEVEASVPLLTLATPLIGHFQIRNRGTIGGSLAHADPAAEYPAIALALDARITAVSRAGRREIPAREFFDGVWTTTLEPDEILADVRFPRWEGRAGFATEEFARRHGDFAIAGAAVGLGADDAGTVTRCAISMFGLGPTPLRAIAAEAAALGQPADGLAAGDLAALAVADLDPPSGDLHASSDYRLRIGAAMVERAIDVAGRRLLEGADHG